MVKCHSWDCAGEMKPLQIQEGAKRVYCCNKCGNRALVGEDGNFGYIVGVVGPSVEEDTKKYIELEKRESELEEDLNVVRVKMESYVLKSVRQGILPPSER